MSVRIIITAGPVNDCTKAEELIKDIHAKGLIADRGYDTNKNLEVAAESSMIVVIPPKKNRTDQRYYDKEIYKQRHLVENAFCVLKRWTGIATRFAKITSSFLAVVQIRCLAAWLNIS